MSDDIAIRITADATELTAGMTESRDQLDQTITTIQRTEASWGALGLSVLSVASQVTGPIISLIAAQKRLTAAVISSAAASAAATPPTLTFAAAVNFLLAPITLTIGALALAAGAIWYFSQASDAAAASTTRSAAATEEAAAQMTALERVTEAFNASAFGAEFAENMTGLRGAADELMTSVGALGEAITKPFVDAGFEAGFLVEMLTGLNGKIQLATTWFEGMAGGVDVVTEAAQSAIREMTLMARMAATGGDRAAAEAWLAQRDAIQAATIEAERFRKANEFALEQVDSLMADATQAAEHHGEIARINAITSADAIDAETEALRAYIAELKQRNQFDEDAQKHAADRANAIAKQKAAIESGQVKAPSSPIDDMIRRAQEEVAALRFGADESKIMGLELGGEDPAKIQQLREELGLKKELKAAEDARREAEKATEAAAAKQQSLFEAAESQMSAMVDQIDLMTGAATKADIAFRNALKAGFTREQADEIKALQEEMSKLEEEEKKKKKPGKTPGITAAMRGSSEAASIMLRGVGGGKTMEQIANKQLQVQQQMLIAVKNNKPPAMQVTNLGIA